VSERERATKFYLVREAEGFVDPRQRALRAQRLRLELREQAVVEPEVDLDALIPSLSASASSPSHRSTPYASTA
jgi:hypothetical protein